MNNQIFYFFYNLAHQSVFFDQAVVFLAVYFPYVVVLLAGLFLLIHHEILTSLNPFKEFAKKWKVFLSVFYSCVLAVISFEIFKSIFQTARPFKALTDVNPLFLADGYAFPSGHTAFFFTLAFAIFFHHKKAGYYFMFFALLIGLARIIAGVHFPIDILGGFVLGSAIAYLLKKR